MNYRSREIATTVSGKGRRSCRGRETLWRHNKKVEEEKISLKKWENPAESSSLSIENSAIVGRKGMRDERW